jgi:uncharacterized membrane protein
VASPPPSGRLTRTETFSDAVFAIAITLLVVDLPFAKVPEGELWRALGDHWGSFVAYGVSFIGIGITWLHHHAIFAHLARVDRTLLLLNLLVLFFVAFTPFPTSLFGEYHERVEDARPAALLYGCTWVFTALTMSALWARACTHPGLLASNVEDQPARRLLRYIRGSAAAYAVGTAIAMVVPILGVALIAPTAAFFLLRSDYRALESEPVEPVA